MGISQVPEPLDGIGRGPEIPALEGSDEVLLGAGTELRPWVRLGGQDDFRQGLARIAVGSSGDFTWSRRAGRSAEVYVASADGGLTSNVVRIPGL